MRNFLNLNFKFISRSLVVAAIFFFSSQVTYAVPVITSFTADKGGSSTVEAGGTLQVNNEQGWTIRWQASNAAGCLINSNEIIGSDDLPKWSSVTGRAFSGLVNMSDAGAAILDAEVFNYTITCYEEVRVNIGGGGIDADYVDFTIASPYTGALAGVATGNRGVSKTITVRVVNQNESSCPSGEAGQACRAVCEGHEDTPACGNCKDTTGATSGACENAFQCISENEGDIEQCYVSQTEANAATQPANPDDGNRCFPKFIGGGGFSLKGCIIDSLDSTLVSLAASFLQLSAYIFEFSVQVGIVQFSALVSDDTDWLTNIWSTIRDILNIAVIFVLLYSAIQVIVGRGGEIKKLIAGVILFGVLTNFSLFLTKAAVDVSNVIALEFYNQMRTTPLSETDFSGGLGATVVSITGLTDLYTPDRLTGEATASVNAKSPVQDSILFRLAMIFVFIAVAFVFLQATFVFIGRTISLILLMIFSPLMFAGGVFSPLQDWIKKWHKEFIGQLTVAPLFMILLYVVLTIMGSLIRAVNEKLASESGDLFSFLALVLLTSTLTIFGFGAALSKAKEFSGSIGGKTVQWGNKLTGFALSGALGGALSGTGSMLRGTIGKPMRGLGNWVENSNSYVGSGLRLLGVNKLKDATLDVRNSKLAGKVGGGVSAALGAAGIDVSSVKPGAGSKTTVTTQKTIPEVYGKFKKDFQARADTRSERLVEKKLKNIEEEQNNAGIKTDNDVFDFELKHRDKDGNIVTTSRDLETDEEWLKEVKKVNQKNKSFIDSKKAEHLNNAPALAINTFGKNFLRRRGTVAEYRARQKYAKQFKDSPEAKLKAYTDDLKKPEYRDILGVSSDQIDAMKDEEKIALWQTLGREAEKEIKDLASRLDRMEPGPDKDEMV
ncbi:MAG: hypothetical protein WAV09_01820, partial [Minisyncoccia bacterium]